METHDLLDAIQALNNKLDARPTNNGGLLETVVSDISNLKTNVGGMQIQLAGTTSKVDQVFNEMFVGTNGSAKSKIDAMMGKWKAVSTWFAAIIVFLSLALIGAGWSTYTASLTNTRALEETRKVIEQLQKPITVQAPVTIPQPENIQQPINNSQKSHRKRTSFLIDEYHANDTLPIISLLIDKEPKEN